MLVCGVHNAVLLDNKLTTANKKMLLIRLDIYLTLSICNPVLQIRAA